jgi:hypothetical protein
MIESTRERDRRSNSHLAKLTVCASHVGAVRLARCAPRRGVRLAVPFSRPVARCAPATERALHSAAARQTRTSHIDARLITATPIKTPNMEPHGAARTLLLPAAATVAAAGALCCNLPSIKAAAGRGRDTNHRQPPSRPRRPGLVVGYVARTKTRSHFMELTA